MHADNAWLAEVLSDVEGLDPRCNTNIHFQYAFCARSEDVAACFSVTASECACSVLRRCSS
jgi:hypothetical protein